LCCLVAGDVAIRPPACQGLVQARREYRWRRDGRKRGARRLQDEAAATIYRAAGTSERRRAAALDAYSTVTDFARLRGWSTSVPLSTAVW
jgi:hypothetical protein